MWFLCKDSVIISGTFKIYFLLVQTFFYFEFVKHFFFIYISLLYQKKKMLKYHKKKTFSLCTSFNLFLVNEHIEVKDSVVA